MTVYEKRPGAGDGAGDLVEVEQLEMQEKPQLF